MAPLLMAYQSRHQLVVHPAIQFHFSEAYGKRLSSVLKIENTLNIRLILHVH